jgi:fucose permease
MSDPQAPNDEEAPRISGGGVVTACGANILIGTLLALYGPAISAFRADFGITLPVAGLALGVQFLGGVVGVLGFARTRGAVSTRTLLAGSLLTLACGAAGFALAPTWPLALLAAFVAGLGFGGIDFGFNDLFARAYHRRGSAMLNILNAHFGLGAIAGPFLVAVLGPEYYPAIFLGVAVALLPLLPGLRGIHAARPEATARQEGAASAEGTARPAATARLEATAHAEGTARVNRAAGRAARPEGAGRRGIRARRPGGLLVAFVLLYMLNVGVEAGVGGWEPTHLEAIGHTAATAASATSVFWLMMTVGRFLVIPLTLRWSDRAIVAGSCVGMAVCLGLAAVPVLAPIAYAGVGLFIAPVFPTGLPWLYRSVPGAQRASAYVIAAAMIGGVAFPPVLGVGIGQTGTRSIPVLLFALNALCLVTIWWIMRASRRMSDPGSRRASLSSAPSSAASSQRAREGRLPAVKPGAGVSYVIQSTPGLSLNSGSCR